MTQRLSHLLQVRAVHEERASQLGRNPEFSQISYEAQELGVEIAVDGAGSPSSTDGYVPSVPS